MILEVHRKVDNNVGDYYSNPSRYFDLDNLKSQELMDAILLYVVYSQETQRNIQ